MGIFANSSPLPNFFLTSTYWRDIGNSSMKVDSESQLVCFARSVSCGKFQCFVYMFCNCSVKFLLILVAILQFPLVATKVLILGISQKAWTDAFRSEGCWDNLIKTRSATPANRNVFVAPLCGTTCGCLSVRLMSYSFTFSTPYVKSFTLSILRLIVRLSLILWGTLYLSVAVPCFTNKHNKRTLRPLGGFDSFFILNNHSSYPRSRKNRPVWFHCSSWNRLLTLQKTWDPGFGWIDPIFRLFHLNMCMVPYLESRPFKPNKIGDRQQAERIDRDNSLDFQHFCSI